MLYISTKCLYIKENIILFIILVSFLFIYLENNEKCLMGNHGEPLKYAFQIYHEFVKL